LNALCDLLDFLRNVEMKKARWFQDEMTSSIGRRLPRSPGGGFFSAFLTRFPARYRIVKPGTGTLATRRFDCPGYTVY
jgi:hypothetical protein